MKGALLSLLALALVGSGQAHAGDTDSASKLAAASATPVEAQCRMPGSAVALRIECPSLTLSFGFMDIRRSRPGNTAIVTNSSGTTTIIGGNNYNFGWHTSPEAFAQFQLGGGWAVEGRYFSSRPSASNYDIANITTFRTAGIGVTILGGGPISSSYASNLDSFELNASRELFSGISVLAGVRHFDLNENLHMNIANAAFTNWADTNRLEGGQLGLKLSYVTPGIPLRLSAAFKAGWYSNEAVNQFTSNIVAGNTSVLSNHPTSGEIDVNVSYFVTDRLSIEASYTGLWLRNVALADEAAATTIQVPGGTSSPVHFSNVSYNGASLRLAYTF